MRKITFAGINILFILCSFIQAVTAQEASAAGEGLKQNFIKLT